MRYARSNVRCLAGLLLLILAAQPRPVEGQASDPFADSLLLTVATAVVQGLEGANDVWPGHWFGGEFILLRPNGGTLAVLAEPPSLSLETRVFTYRFGDILQVGYLIPEGRLEIEERIGFREFEGRQLLVWRLMDDVYSISDPLLATVVAVYHEAFHIHQIASGWFRDGPPLGFDNHPPRRVVEDEEFQEKARSERELLDEALATEGRNAVQSVLRSYLAARALRMEHLEPEYREYEEYAERFEGSAHLLGYEAGLLAVHGSTDGVKDLVRADLRGTPSFDEPGWSLGPYRQWHIFATGAAIGLLLDSLDVSWREELQAGATFLELLTTATAADR